jgi:hypothetical protein
VADARSWRRVSARNNATPLALHNQITIFDHASTQPWTVTGNHHRNTNPRPVWPDQECAEGQMHFQIGSETCMRIGDGYLMPAEKKQGPPGL